MARPLAETARVMVASLLGADRARGEAEAIRLGFSFVEAFERAPPADRPGLLTDCPEKIGDPRFDALLAGIAERLCARTGLSSPAWVGHPSRFLGTWWFVAGLRSLEADALVNSPISFARRGVFISGDALSYA